MKKLIKDIYYSSNDVKIITYTCKPTIISGINICKVITKIRKRIFRINVWITIKKNYIDIYTNPTDTDLVRDIINKHIRLAKAFDNSLTIKDIYLLRE